MLKTLTCLSGLAPGAADHHGASAYGSHGTLGGSARNPEIHSFAPLGFVPFLGGLGYQAIGL